MASIDPFTGELCIKIAYVGPPHDGAWQSMGRIVVAQPAAQQRAPVRLAAGASTTWFRPARLTCRGRPVRVQVVGLSSARNALDSSLRIMLRDVSGIVHISRVTTCSLRDTLFHQDALRRAAAFWQYDLERVPQVTVFNGRWCSHCGQTLLDDALVSPLLNPWGAPESWSIPSQGRGVIDGFSGCLSRALERAEAYLGPPVVARPVPVEPDTLARRAFALVDAAEQSALLSPEDRAWLLKQAQLWPEPVGVEAA